MSLSYQVEILHYQVRPNERRVYRLAFDRVKGSADAIFRMGRLFESRVVQGPQNTDGNLLDVSIDFSSLACVLSIFLSADNQVLHGFQTHPNLGPKYHYLAEPLVYQSSQWPQLIAPLFAARMVVVLYQKLPPIHWAGRIKIGCCTR